MDVLGGHGVASPRSPGPLSVGCMGTPFHPRNSKLASMGDVLAATEVLDPVAKGALDEAQASAALRENVGVVGACLPPASSSLGRTRCVRWRISLRVGSQASSHGSRSMAALTRANYVCTNATTEGARADMLVQRLEERSSRLIVDLTFHFMGFRGGRR